MTSFSRFSGRVENYVKYRPGYPEALGDLIESQIPRGSTIADVGSGTGKLSELFLRRGYSVAGIEPNAEMRVAAEDLCSKFPGFQSLAGAAEALPLPDGAVDAVAAGQAFHWFDREKTRAEFERVLKPEGHVLLVWNDRSTDATPFLAGYERLFQEHCPDYKAIGHKKFEEGELRAFFAPGWMREARFHNEQTFDWEGLAGRLLSSSYVPAAGPVHDRILRELRRLFEHHCPEGRAVFVYQTRLWYGQFAGAGEQT